MIPLRHPTLSRLTWYNNLQRKTPLWISTTAFLFRKVQLTGYPDKNPERELSNDTERRRAETKSTAPCTARPPRDPTRSALPIERKRFRCRMESSDDTSRTVHALPVGASRQKNCPGYSQDSVIVIIIGEAIASPQLSLYKRKIFVYNKASCNETYYRHIFVKRQ